MFCLSLFDVTGIQKFVFATRRTKENVGASLLVSKIFEDFLLKKIKKEPDAVVDWESTERFLMLSDDPPTAEVIYIGGGNALVAFREKRIAIEVTECFSKRLLKETGGELGVAVAHLEVDPSDCFKSSVDQLRQKLDEKKLNLPYNRPLAGLAVTREGVSDGLPAVERKNDEWLSCPAKSKLRAVDSKDKTFSKFAPDGFNFPLEFDDMGRNRETGESLMAVVHIDGNSMGKEVRNYCFSAANDFEEAVKRMRKFSGDIRSAYETTFKEMAEMLAEALGVEDFSENFKLKPKDLPLRPLILSGDDVTFVCDGRLGLVLSEKFLQLLYQKKAPNNKNYSACAGIAIVKPHFPFYRSYALAEELCLSAKNRAKKDAKDGNVASWLDFHIIYSGASEELSTLRRRTYNFPKLTAPDKDGNVERYHLLCRPYCVVGDEEKTSKSWDGAKKRLRYVKGMDDKKTAWPRSKLKGLRDAFFISREAVTDFCDRCKSRGCFLKEELGPLFDCDRTPWFDTLELLDVYLELPAAQKGGRVK